jgi:hypothetical protein
MVFVNELWNNISGTTILFINLPRIHDNSNDTHTQQKPIVSIMTPSPHHVYQYSLSLRRYFGRKVQLGQGKQAAKSWFGLEK